MANGRPPDWDWVTATHLCKAEVMIGRLHTLAQQNVKARNTQLGREVFRLTELNGIEFFVSKDAGISDRVFFKVNDNLSEISVLTQNRETTLYTVGLDINGLCKFRRGTDELDAWQILKAGLDQLFFG